MTFIEVVDVATEEPDGRLLGSSIDLPQPGFRIEGTRFDVAGWALGRGGTSVRIECLVNGQVATSPSRTIRPDLADAFPDLRGAHRAGFLAEIQMPLAGTAEVELRAVVARGSRVTLGRVSVRRRWRASSDPTLRTLASIVIAAGDRPELLSATVDSALSQSYSSVEIVVVGDEMTAEGDPSRYGNVRWVRADAPGTAAAWDAGIRETNGDYLVFLDVGETLPADALAEAIRALEAEPAAGRFAGMYRRALLHAIGPFASDRSRHASADRPGPGPSSSVEHRSELSPSPRVSVVIPCYRQAHFLPEAIESVLDQSVDAEVIVVDDGSPDNTAAVARRYPGVRYIRQANRGLARARNRGLDDAVGEFLVFLDADDRLLPGALASGVGALEEHSECVLACGHSAFATDDGSPAPPAYRPQLGDDPYRQILAGCPIIGPGTVMYRRSLFDSIRAFDPSISPAADYDLYYRVARAHPIRSHDAVVGVYRRHGGNMTSGSRTMLRANVTALRRQRWFVLRRPRYWRAYRRGVRYWQGHQGRQVAQQVQRDLHHRRPAEGLRGLAALLVWSPRTLLLLARARRTLIPIREWTPEG